jgi:4-hydroxy-4-methyl-2-oxoglutarate aldolase
MSDSKSDTGIARVASLDTATVSDALDRLGIVGQCYRIQPLDPQFRLAGRAFTVQYGAAANPPGTVGDYIDEVPVGGVIVLANHGRDDATVWGDILTEIAHRRQLGGTVIDGICRDTALSRKLGYPIYSRGHWMRTGKDRVQVESVNTPVTVGNARVAPGDLLRGDADGVLVIPREHEEAVLSAAEEIERTEQSIREAVRSGLPLDQARVKFRYHNLQTRSR